jgi:hypothetical protein
MAFWVMMYKLHLPADMPEVKCDRSYIFYTSMKRKDHPEIFQTQEREEPVTINEDYVLIDEILKTSPQPLVAGNTITAKLEPKEISEKAVREVGTNVILSLHLDRPPMSIISVARKVRSHFHV